jgi:zinc-binding alcohol dehydrogenase/oxidoreductase
MRAAVVTRPGGPEVIEIAELPDPVPEPGEVLVRLEAAALNRRDVWSRTAEATPPGAVPGSDGTGAVDGQPVVIVPYLRWGDREDAPGDDGEILGIPTQGTHADLIVVPAENVRPRPEALSVEEAAALPLAGLTAWRALVTRARVGPGARVLVTGAGSGVSTFLVQIAHALGAEVVVTSSAGWKLDRARELGASAGVLYTDPEWPEQVGRVDIAVDSAGAPAWPGILRCLRRGGTLVSFGRTRGSTAEVDIPTLYYGQLTIHGTTMGSPREFDALLHHLDGAGWRPVVDSVFPLAEAPAAHTRLDDPDRFGKVVLRIG